ncbi:hypothetical protein N7326_07610 [Corynebacterium sp. ES2794-CONJ1]|nr:hypothetical protein [Corynebacterium sp. ES2794-CONJ1]MCU9519732.1 hypothetical protein [Corynebacterium sp. ES2794-CONJ1]
MVLPKPLALVFTILVILAIPLPFALYLGGFEWMSSGSQAGSKEFVVSYVFGLLVLLGSLAAAVYRGRRNQEK